MAKRIKDKRRPIPAAKLQPRPEWIDAILITLLHKVAILQEQVDGEPGRFPEITISVRSLDNFCKLTTNNKTQYSFNPDNQTVTITAPEIPRKEPDQILVPKQKAILRN